MHQTACLLNLNGTDKAVEQERKDAKPATDLSWALLFWYVGARLSVRAAAPEELAPAAAASTALAGFTKAPFEFAERAYQALFAAK